MAMTFAARLRNKLLLKTVLKWVGAATAGISLGVGIVQAKGRFVEWRTRNEMVSSLIATSRLERSAREYSGAWRDAQHALDLQPRCRECREEQLEVALEWLRNIRLNSVRGEHSFSEVTEKVLPVIYRAAAEAKGTRAADLSAHLAWADFLSWREGQGGLDVDGKLRGALERDPANLYAHAMLGLWILYPGGGNGSPAESADHFTAALRAARSPEDRRFVRNFQLAALLNWDDEFVPQIVRVLDEMRRSGQALEPQQRARMAASVYQAGFERLWPQMSSVLSPAEHLATFIWLTDAKDREDNAAYRIIYARLTSESGDPSRAIRLYQNILSDSPFLRPTMKAALQQEIQRASVRR